MTNKKCAQCGQEKPIEDFSKSYKNLCKSCVAERERLKRKINKAFGVPEDIPNAYIGRGISIPIPEDATFIPPMRFQASVAAMQGLMSNMGEYDTVDELARLAVGAADALINELNKKKDEVATDKQAPV